MHLSPVLFVFSHFKEINMRVTFVCNSDFEKYILKCLYNHYDT